jgi:DNA-binding NtrC family response regulator
MIERLLVVEDDASVRTTVTTFLELEGYQVDAVSSTSEAIRRLGETAYPIVITDIYLDERTGLDVLDAARKKHPDCAVILMTARGTMETVMAATQGGAFDYIAKPFDLTRSCRRSSAPRAASWARPGRRPPTSTTCPNPT